MTEYTIIGNLRNINYDSFTLEEGKELYKITPTHKSNLLEELYKINLGSRLKVTGIIKGDKLLCSKATMLLGDTRNEE